MRPRPSTTTLSLLIVVAFVVLATIVPHAAGLTTNLPQLPTCADSLLKYFPKNRVDSVIGALTETMGVGTACIFMPDIKQGTSNLMVWVFDVESSDNALLSVNRIDELLETFGVSGLPNLKVQDGGDRIGDRYYFGAHDEGYFGATKKCSLVLIAASHRLPSLDQAQIDDLVGYAAGQMSCTAAAAVPGSQDGYQTPPQSDRNWPAWLWLLIGLGAVLSLLLVWWLKRGKSQPLAPSPTPTPEPEPSASPNPTPEPTPESTPEPPPSSDATPAP